MIDEQELRKAFNEGWACVSIYDANELEQAFQHWFRAHIKPETGPNAHGAYRGFDLLDGRPNRGKVTVGKGENSGIHTVHEAYRHPDGTWRYPPDDDLLEVMKGDRDDWQRRYLLALSDHRNSLEHTTFNVDHFRDEREANKVLIEQLATARRELTRLRKMVTKLGGVWRKVKDG